MAVTVVAEVRIGGLDQFLEVFGGDGLAKRAEHGCTGARVLTPVGETGRVVVLLEFPDAGHAAAFRQDASAAPIMRRGGAQGPPTFTVTEEAAVFPH